MIGKLLKVGALLVGIVALFALLLAIVIFIENDRGEKAWNAYRAGAEYRGLVLDRSIHPRKTIPDAENFAAAPILKNPKWDRVKESISGILPCGPNGEPEDNQKFDIELAGDLLASFEEELEALAQAARLPHSDFGSTDIALQSTQLPNLNTLLAAADLYHLRALTAIRTGHPVKAIADIETSLRMANHLSKNSVLISYLVELAVVSRQIQSVRGGLYRQSWTEPELARLQGLLEKATLLEHCIKAINGERSFIYKNITESSVTIPFIDHWEIPFIDLTSIPTPRGWTYQNLLFVNRTFDESVLPSINLKERRITPNLFDEASPEDLNHPHRALGASSLGVLKQTLKRASSVQTTVDFAIIACALERYRLAHGDFPSKLQALVPAYLAAIPNDLFTGEPLSYRKEDGGKYLLYSVGWNQIDDGGEPSPSNTASGDLVWKMSTRPHPQ